MGIVRHSRSEMERLREAGQVAAATLATVVERVRPGVSTGQIDEWVRADTEARGARPSQLGYKGFPASVCTSPNDVVCHGIPDPDRVLREGDIVNVDVTSEWRGFHGDTSVTLMLGEVSDARAHVTRVARHALEVGIAAVQPGGRLGDVGSAIEQYVQSEGCDVVRDYGGHGIGRRMHMEPHVAHHGTRGRGPRLKPGMAFTIEPMVTLGHPALRLLEDGWTVVTEDGTPSAQFEHTVLVTDQGCEVLTLPSPPTPT